VVAVHCRLDLGNLSDHPSDQLKLNDIGSVTVKTHRPLICDTYSTNRTTGSFIFVDPITNLTVGAGMIEKTLAEDTPMPAPGLCDGAVIWFTGLSSSGKTTLSESIYERLWSVGHRVELLDGDEVRLHLSRGLGFSKEDRDENIRRIGFVAELLARQGVIVLVSAISPYREARNEVRSRIAKFLEVYVNAPLRICEERDVKGLYRKARRGALSHFTGIDDPYEPPIDPDIECRTDLETVADCTDRLVAHIESLVLRQSAQRTA
jgi:adenylyl-sulfate kinase